MSYTPGPWCIAPETDGTQIVAYNAAPWAIRQVIATPDRGSDWIANATLIAAAPDLLSALRGLIADVGIPAIYQDRPAYNAARAAILKATKGHV